MHARSSAPFSEVGDITLLLSSFSRFGGRDFALVPASGCWDSWHAIGARTRLSRYMRGRQCGSSLAEPMFSSFCPGCYAQQLSFSGFRTGARCLSPLAEGAVPVHGAGAGFFSALCVLYVRYQHLTQDSRSHFLFQTFQSLALSSSVVPDIPGGCRLK